MNSPARRKQITWLGPAIIAIAFIVTAALTWRKWGDVLVDFGLQLYLPWQISQGAVLYKDIHYLPGGPFSQYFNATLFKLFGVSFLTLIVTNLLISAGLIALLYRRFLAAADAWTATCISLAVVLVFTFGHYSDIGNYNYITPYCHEVWHGLVLSVVVIALLTDWLKTERMWRIAAAGFCTGLVFMTKPDVFVALSVVVLAAFTFAIVAKKPASTVVKSVAIFLVIALIPLLSFLSYFHEHEDWSESLRSVCFAWMPLIKGGVVQNAYYRWVTGLDAPWLHIRAMLIHLTAVVVFVAISSILFRRNLTTPLNRIAGVVWIGLMMALASGFDWIECGHSLPLLDAILCGVLLTQFSRSKDAGFSFPLLWSLFALMLLTKLGLYSRIWHYGFALAMPAFVGTVFLLFWLLPMRLEKYRVNVRWFRIAAALVLLTGMTKLFLVSQSVYRDKTAPIGDGSDRLFALNTDDSPAVPAMQSALAWINKNTPQNATLAVLPEGTMINYLSRRTNPTHYPIWVPPEVAAFGQSNITTDFENNPPEYVMLIHRDASEYGFKNFGQDERFGGELMRWIQAHYTSEALIDKEPLVGSSFGIKILKRNEVVQ